MGKPSLLSENSSVTLPSEASLRRQPAMFWLRRVFLRIEVELVLAALELVLATLAVLAALEKRDMDGMLWSWFLGRVDQ